MGTTASKHYTWDDYVQLPDDGNRYEILEGELVVTPAPMSGHQFTVLAIGRLLGAWTDERGGEAFVSPIDVVLADDTICQPDAIWISPDRSAEIVGDRIHGIPDLVVEVLSKSTARRDRTRKADIYASYGAREYWLANPADETIEIRVRRGRRFVSHAVGTGNIELASTLDESLRIVPARLFRRYPKVPGKKPTS